MVLFAIVVFMGHAAFVGSKELAIVHMHAVNIFFFYFFFVKNDLKREEKHLSKRERISKKRDLNTRLEKKNCEEKRKLVRKRTVKKKEW